MQSWPVSASIIQSLRFHGNQSLRITFFYIVICSSSLNSEWNMIKSDCIGRIQIKWNLELNLGIIALPIQNHFDAEVIQFFIKAINFTEFQ